MAQFIALLLTLLQLISLAPLPTPAPGIVTQRLRSGEWLRMHIIAQDDTAAMQQLKLLVRDAVQECYAANRPEDTSMLSAAARLLPRLTLAARESARAAGFTGDVTVTLGSLPFDDRQLAGMTIPAGEYPALVIRLGDGRGRNWWGLIDPDAALMLAAVLRDEEGTPGSSPAAEAGKESAPVHWDWSWEALLSALFGLPMTAQ